MSFQYSASESAAGIVACVAGALGGAGTCAATGGTASMAARTAATARSARRRMPKSRLFIELPPTRTGENVSIPRDAAGQPVANERDHRVEHRHGARAAW